VVVGIVGEVGVRTCELTSEAEMTERLLKICLDSFLDGFSGSGFFERLSRPGAPTKLFADEGDECPHKDLVQKLLMPKDARNDNDRL
jgi:hypothetical protein